MTMLNSLFPILYGAAFLLLLWQAFRVMSQGFSANRPMHDGGDRTGKITMHPELLNPDGQITEEDLLTVRFSNDNEPPASKS